MSTCTYVYGEGAASKVYVPTAPLLVELFANHFRKRILYSSLEQESSGYKSPCFWFDLLWFCFKFLKTKWWLIVISFLFPFLKALTKTHVRKTNETWVLHSRKSSYFLKIFLIQGSVSIPDHIQTPSWLSWRIKCCTVNRGNFNTANEWTDMKAFDVICF